MKKRTCIKGYTKRQQAFDQFASRMAGVVDDDQTKERRARRRARLILAERKRRVYAKLSGTGARECARRVAR